MNASRGQHSEWHTPEWLCDGMHPRCRGSLSVGALWHLLRSAPYPSRTVCRAALLKGLLNIQIRTSFICFHSSVCYSTQSHTVESLFLLCGCRVKPYGCGIFQSWKRRKKSSKVGGLQAEFSVYRDVSCWPAVLNSFAFKYSSRDIHSLVCHSPYPSLLPYSQLGSFLWSSLFPSLWFCDP